MGATSISSSFIGLGQRAGNTATEEIIMALELLYGIKTGVDLTKLQALASKVSELSGYSLSPHKPIVGSGNFTWEAGIPVAALSKMPVTVEPFEPELLGRKHDIVVGKKSGKANIIWRLKELNLEVPSDEKLSQLLDDIKGLSVQLGRAINNEEFIDIVKK